MEHFIDIHYKSINKFGEELCGDKVEIAPCNGGYVAVLSDGLGSGVKANILSTLTSKIAATMLQNGATIVETIETIISTLPECKVRKLAYSTFTIIKIDKNYNAYIAEYDSPSYFYYSRGCFRNVKRNELQIGSKTVYESNIQLKLGDSINVISDGAIHAGIGGLLNLGWGWEEINDYLRNLNHVNSTSQILNKNFIDVCNNLYDNKPGDDTTILTVKIKSPLRVDVFVGPPADPKSDKYISQKMVEGNSKKVICGGTTALIAERELKKKLFVDIDSFSKEIPPIAKMEGFHLITEGVLTLGKTLERIESFNNNLYDSYLTDKSYNGCTLLTKLLLEDSTHINFYVGKAVNPAHQNTNFPAGYNIKQKIITDLISELKKLGKEVLVSYL